MRAPGFSAAAARIRCVRRPTGEHRQPSFRSAAAVALLVTLLSGTAALALAAFMGLRNLVTALALNLQEVHIPVLFDVARWLLAHLSAPSVLSLTGFGVAMLVVAWVLRQVVLAGLRD